MDLTLNKKHLFQTHSDRFIELDVLRGSAIILMIFLHLLWDLDYFGVIPLNTTIYRMQVFVPTLFFVLLGICLVVSKNKKKVHSFYDETRYNKHLFVRGLKIFGFGMILTFLTLVFIPDRPIIFGVLHCIGLSIILSIPFLKLKYYNLIFASLIVLAGFLIGQYSFENPTVIHLAIGMHQSNVYQYTVDYFPILPWFGACLFGMVLGDFLYKDNKRRFSFPDISRYKPVTMFSWLGKHSLAIYLLHQPVIAGALSVLLFFSIF